LQVAQDALGVATVSAAQFVGATSLTVDGVTTKVTGVKDGLTVAFNGGTIANTITFAAGTTAATVDVTGSKGTITLDDASTTTATTTIKTLAINGAIKATAGTNAAHTSSAAGTITITEDLGTSNAETITTVNLGVTSSGTVDLTDMSKLTTVNASASTGALTITTSAAGNARLANVTGGTGADKITVDLETNANGTSSAPKTASVDGGAGNDTITITADVGTGKVSVDAGSGDDTVVTSIDALQGDLKIDGGTGTDKIKLTAETENTDNGDELSATDYIVLEESITSFERAEFVGVEYLDASKVSQFTTIDAGDDTDTIINISSSQKINTAIDSAFTAEGYIALGTEEADDAGLTATKYAGTLSVTATDDSIVSLNASSATLNVNNVSSVAAQHVGDQTASEVTINGNLKTLTVAFAATAGKDYVVAPTTEVISAAVITIDSAEEDADGNLTDLGNLTSVTLTGVGSATIDNSNNDDVSKLVTVDASGLGGTWTLPSSNAGDPLGGLEYTANIATAETIKLGVGQDVITVASTYAKTDTITGFKLVAQADGSLDSDLSDSLVIEPESDSEWIAITSGLTGTTLAANLRIVAAKVGASDDAKYDNAVFQWGGNTYIFSESETESTTVDAADVLVKLTGLIDLDLLVESLTPA
jgi:trimeric autotransporter adhesin